MESRPPVGGHDLAVVGVAEHLAGTRGLLTEQWRYMQEHETWRATPSSNARVASLVLEARNQHGPEEMPRAVYLRTELNAAGFRFGPNPF
jgi:hypothetical protein